MWFFEESTEILPLLKFYPCAQLETAHKYLLGFYAQFKDIYGDCAVLMIPNIDVVCSMLYHSVVLYNIT